MLATNVLDDSDELVCLNLKGRVIWVRECAAFASIETYEEIFGRENHFTVPGFEIESAETVIDIGANEGFFALKCRSLNPGCRLVCVEPSPYAFELLARNVESNGLENIELINAAAGIAEGEIDMPCLKQVTAISGAGLEMVDRPWLDGGYVEKVRVRQVRGDWLIDKYGIEKADMLKIDVEGMEAEVIKGSPELLARAGRVVVERHSRELRFEVLGLMEERGFELVYEEDPGFERYYGDMYFVKKQRGAG